MRRIFIPCFTLLVCLLHATASHARPALEVVIEGVEGGPRQNVEGYLSILLYRDSETLTEAVVRRLHARAPGEIRQALQPFGYYRPEIRSELQQDNDVWRARYTITPGEPARIARIDIRVFGEGADSPAFRRWRERLALQEGAVLRHSEYNAAKESLLLLASELGYLDARYRESALRVNTLTRQAEIMLHLDTGPQYYFGPLAFEQDIMDESFLRRFLTFEAGDPFNVGKLLELQYALIDSQYYSLVEVEPRREAVDEQRRVPITVQMAPRRKHLYRLGLGFGTDTGPRLTLGWDNRRVNQRGHRSSVEMRFSEVEDSFNARYFVPLHNPATDQIIYSLGAQQSELGDTFSEKQNVGIARSTLAGAWRQTGYVQFESERNEIGDVTDTTRLILPGINWTRSRSDNPVVPMRGWRVLLDLRGTHTGLSSDATFAQLRLQGKWIQALGEQTRILLRGEVGTTRIDDEFSLPLSQRFFAGGDQSVRGFGYNDLGPVNADGDVVGGKHLLVGSVELERRFKGEWSNWGLAAFVDAGNAMDDFDVPLARGAGVGLRWKTPVGMVRVDVARPLSVDDPDWRLHLSIGPDL